MGEYTGRATRGIALDLTWGTLFLVITIIFLILGYYSGGYAPTILILIIFMESLVVWLFHHLYFAIAPKKLVVDDIGIFLYSRNRLVKKIYWNEVRRVVSSSLGGRYPRVGFSVVGEGKKVININDRDVLGPEKTLRKAFLEIAKIAAEKGIIIDDSLGWAPGIIGGLEEVEPEEYMGIWYRCKDAYTKKSLMICLVVLAIGVILVAVVHYFSISHSDEIYGAGIGFIFAGVLLMLIIIGDFLYQPKEIYFDDSGIKMRFLISKEKEFPWYQIKDVRCVEDIGYTVICPIMKTCYAKKLEPKVCKTLKLAFKKHKG